jgi:hypothetical protein
MLNCGWWELVIAIKCPNSQDEEGEDKPMDEELLSLKESMGDIEDLYPNSRCQLRQNISGGLFTLPSRDSIKGYPRVIPCRDL